MAKFDIIVGSLYSAIAVIEATIPLVRLYSIASPVALLGLCILAVESIRTALHFQVQDSFVYI